MSIEKISRAGVGAVVSTCMRNMSIGKNEWPKDWIKQQDRWIDMDIKTQSFWRKLGWSELLWETGSIPPKQRKSWEELRDAERKAAKELGYCQKLWSAQDTTCVAGQRGPPKRRRNIYPAFDGPGDWESSYVTGKPTAVCHPPVTPPGRDQ